MRGITICVKPLNFFFLKDFLRCSLLNDIFLKLLSEIRKPQKGITIFTGSEWWSCPNLTASLRTEKSSIHTSIKSVNVAEFYLFILLCPSTDNLLFKHISFVTLNSLCQKSWRSNQKIVFSFKSYFPHYIQQHMQCKLNKPTATKIK